MSLAESCVIATLTGKMWHAKKYDEKTTNEILEKKQAKYHAGRFNKSLMPDEPTLKAIKKKLAECRNYHYENTLPWAWKGGQLLPSAMFLDYSKQIGKFINEFDALVDTFTDYDYYYKAVEAAKIEIGHLFSYSDYPSSTEVRKSFYITLDTDPVPTAGDIRVDLPSQQVEALKEAWRVKEGRITKAATEHLWQKLHDMTKRFNETTSDPDKQFQATMISNVSNFTDILDKLNIEENQFLKEIGQEVAVLGKYDAKDLREDAAAREQASEESGQLLDKIKRQIEAFNG